MSRLEIHDQPFPPNSDDERDVFAWSVAQADLLRQGRFGEADLTNIIEEIESVGRSERRSLTSSYRLVITHLLKWHHRPERRGLSWTITIGRGRGNIAEDERDNPTLAARAAELVADVYLTARRDAADETGLPLRTFPTSCPLHRRVPPRPRRDAGLSPCR